MEDYGYMVHFVRSFKLYLFICLFLSFLNFNLKFLTNIYIYIHILHSLPKVKHREENANANFQKPIKIEEDAIHCRGRWNDANMLGNSQLCFHVKKYGKRAVL